MSSSLLLAVASAGCFLALAHAAVSTTRATFRRVTLAMALTALPLAIVAPAAGIALLAPVLFSRRLANAPVPATVPELLARYSPADR
jgi:ABC-type enterobactin transport system permease subunit